MTDLAMNHLLGLEDVDRGQITALLDLAQRMKEIGERPLKKVPSLRGKMVCHLFVDTQDAAGNPVPDGVEDPAGPSDCLGAEDGPYGTAFTCVAMVNPYLAQPLNICRPGTTFAPCVGDSDCPLGEVCKLRYIMSEYQAVCETAVDGGVGVGAACNSNPLEGEIVTCESELCFGFGCGGVCQDDSDCLTDTCVGGTCSDGAACSADTDCSTFECVESQTIFSDAPQLTWNQCRGKGCTTNARSVSPLTVLPEPTSQRMPAPTVKIRSCRVKHALLIVTYVPVTDSAQSVRRTTFSPPMALALACIPLRRRIG